MDLFLNVLHLAIQVLTFVFCVLETFHKSPLQCVFLMVSLDLSQFVNSLHRALKQTSTGRGITAEE